MLTTRPISEYKLELVVGDAKQSFVVERHQTDPLRLNVTASGQPDPVAFDMIRTSIGRWQACGDGPPAWLRAHVPDLGKAFEQQTGRLQRRGRVPE